MSAKIEPFWLFGRRAWLMRDDLLGEFNGNKARKLKYLLNADLSGISAVVSHGSSQSNAMYSLSVFARQKGLKFIYVVSHLSDFLAQNPSGNFKAALANGMEILIDQNRQAKAKLIAAQTNALFIPEGVACEQAELGFIEQAREISAFAAQNSIVFDIFLPSGTGTSAAYLAKHSEFNVYTCACVGDSQYLKAQIFELDPHSRVKILLPPRKFHFANPQPELFEIWQEICEQSGVLFELLYDPVGFLTIKNHISEFKNELLYIHQGGILGNQTQLVRYERKQNLKEQNENSNHKRWRF